MVLNPKSWQLPYVLIMLPFFFFLSFVYFADSELTSWAGSDCIPAVYELWKVHWKWRTGFQAVLFPLSVLFSSSNFCPCSEASPTGCRFSSTCVFKIFIFSELMNAGQTAGALGLRPGLILTLLAVSRWIKPDRRGSIFATVTTGWHVRDSLSLQMSSLMSSLKSGVCVVWCVYGVCVCVFGLGGGCVVLLGG